MAVGNYLRELKRPCLLTKIITEFTKFSTRVVVVRLFDSEEKNIPMSIVKTQWPVGIRPYPYA